jgi:hypothetical protein
MVTYNLNEQARRPVIDYAAAHGKAILVRKSPGQRPCVPEPRRRPGTRQLELLRPPRSAASAIVGTINPLHLAHNVATVAQVLRGH